MKIKIKTTKSSFLKKIFIKISRLFGFEIIDQANFYLPNSDRFADVNLSKIGQESIVIPMGKTKITRPVKSLDIILRTCASVNMLTQSKERVFKGNKSEYSLKTLKSIINSINNKQELFKTINLKLTIIDHNSEKEVLEKFRDSLKNRGNLTDEEVEYLWDIILQGL